MLSIIVATYQAEAHIGRLLDSLDAGSEFEIVVVDDGSTDATWPLVKSWCTGRGNSHCYRVTHRGPGGARQFGLESATADFVTFVDADDEVSIASLRRSLDCLAESRADVLVAGYGRRTSNRRESRPLRLSAPCVPLPSTHVVTKRAAVWGKIYSRCFLMNKSVSFPDVPVAEDVVFSMRVALAQPRVVGSAEVFYWYRAQTEGQLTRTRDYEVKALTSLSTIRREARGRGARAWLLGQRVFLMNAGHLWKRVPHGQRRAFMGATIRSWING